MDTGRERRQLDVSERIRRRRSGESGGVVRVEPTSCVEGVDVALVRGLTAY